MCRILVVDDDEPVRRGIRSLLSSQKGWFVCGEAADGLQAVEQAKSLRPDLIIMDVSMPNMNGLELAESYVVRSADRGFSSSARTILQSFDDKQVKPTLRGLLKN